jgi:hypothetical protein
MGGEVVGSAPNVGECRQPPRLTFMLVASLLYERAI